MPEYRFRCSRCKMMFDADRVEALCPSRRDGPGREKVPPAELVRPEPVAPPAADPAPGEDDLDDCFLGGACGMSWDDIFFPK